MDQHQSDRYSKIIQVTSPVRWMAASRIAARLQAAGQVVDGNALVADLTEMVAAGLLAVEERERGSAAPYRWYRHATTSAAPTREQIIVATRAAATVHAPGAIGACSEYVACRVPMCECPGNYPCTELATVVDAGGASRCGDCFEAHLQTVAGA